MVGGCMTFNAWQYTGKEKEDPPETIIYVDNPRVWCMGENMDHPKV